VLHVPVNDNAHSESHSLRNATRVMHIQCPIAGSTLANFVENGIPNGHYR
jgi:hypothetical protein